MGTRFDPTAVGSTPLEVSDVGARQNIVVEGGPPSQRWSVEEEPNALGLGLLFEMGATPTRWLQRSIPGRRPEITLRKILLHDVSMLW